MGYTKTEWKNDSIPCLDEYNLNRMEEGIANSICKDGSVAMEAELTLAGSPINNLGATPKEYVDNNFILIKSNAITVNNTDFDTFYTIPNFSDKYMFMINSFSSGSERHIIYFGCDEEVSVKSNSTGSIEIQITKQGKIQLKATRPNSLNFLSSFHILCIPCQVLSMN